MIYGQVKRRAKVSISLEIDPDEFVMPLDGDPTVELTELFEELVEHIVGTQLLTLKIKCTGGTGIYDRRSIE